MCLYVLCWLCIVRACVRVCNAIKAIRHNNFCPQTSASNFTALKHHSYAYQRATICVACRGDEEGVKWLSNEKRYTDYRKTTFLCSEATFLLVQEGWMQACKSRDNMMQSGTFAGHGITKNSAVLRLNFHTLIEGSGWITAEMLIAMSLWLQGDGIWQWDAHA